MKKIAVVVGSLRKDSNNRKLANAFAKLSAEFFQFDIIDLSALPHYNEDLWQDPPESVVALRKSILESDAVLFVTPEYNRAVPGIVQDVLDWGSRPWGESAWPGKPVAIAGASIGVIGTAVAQSQLRNSLLILGTYLMGQPEMYIHFKPELLTEEFEVNDAGTRVFFTTFLEKYDKWIDSVRH